ncbi:MAG: hypothetical protein EZS28_013813 [Streblomastix strix]|uniref:Uncharacterized protein n=1 Tax=Streblomastix strix TaxID=222440 RepID=A0A5J4W7W4_9EUKA|nr:MAG: hypothetical protein EZS28_013813 [Streblomastix strix]
MDSQGISTTTPTGPTDQLGANGVTREGEENKINDPPDEASQLPDSSPVVTSSNIEGSMGAPKLSSGQTTISQQIGVGYGDDLIDLGEINEAASKLEDEKAPSSPKEEQQIINISQQSPNANRTQYYEVQIENQDQIIENLKMISNLPIKEEDLNQIAIRYYSQLAAQITHRQLTQAVTHQELNIWDLSCVSKVRRSRNKVKLRRHHRKLPPPPPPPPNPSMNQQSTNLLSQVKYASSRVRVRS